MTTSLFGLATFAFHMIGIQSKPSTSACKPQPLKIWIQANRISSYISSVLDATIYHSLARSTRKNFLESCLASRLCIALGLGCCSCWSLHLLGAFLLGFFGKISNISYLNLPVSCLYCYWAWLFQGMIALVGLARNNHGLSGWHIQQQNFWIRLCNWSLVRAAARTLACTGNHLGIMDSQAIISIGLFYLQGKLG